MNHPPTDRAWVATRKGLFELRQRQGQRQGQRHGLWAIERVSFLADPVSMVLPPDANGRMLAALNLGHFGCKLHASDDAGATWREVAAPTYPAQPTTDTGVPWKLALIGCLERAGGRIWAGTHPGGLFSSADGGSSWQLNEPLWQRPERSEWMGGGYDTPGIHSVCGHPQRDGELLLGLSVGGVWLSPDAGQTWALRGQGLRADYKPPERAGELNIQDPHRIVRCPAEPDKLWLQHHCGIFKSVDGAATWQPIPAPLSGFGFAVAVHPQHGNTAWFVPAVKDEKRVPVDAALAVNRTRDGGQTFETLRQGLPQQDTYDLVYRHALDVAADGERLLMGSTTGHLWATGDGGDHWQTAFAHLPPIYAVRFG